MYELIKGIIEEKLNHRAIETTRNLDIQLPHESATKKLKPSIS